MGEFLYFCSFILMVWFLLKVRILLSEPRTRSKGSRYYVPRFKSPTLDSWHPKWNAAHREYVDHDHLQWQKEFSDLEMSKDLPGRGSTRE